MKNNTGYFTHRSLENSELFVGIDFSNHDKINAIIKTHDSYILFPSDDALNISTNNPQKIGQNIAIFLIDSTWSCAKKIFNESSNLHSLRHMSFTSLRESSYQIKEQPKSNYLSTIESTLVVLEYLNYWNIENVSSQNLNGFLMPFHKMIEYQKKLIKNSLSNTVRFKKYTLFDNLLQCQKKKIRGKIEF